MIDFNSSVNKTLLSKAMNEKQFLRDYLQLYKDSLINNDVSDKLITLKEKLLKIKNNNSKVIIAGNGGSAAIASHVCVDLTKQGGIRSVNFNEADLITCFSNDYGYENWLGKSIEFYADKGDMTILISSSGKSENILNAAHIAKKLGLYIVTLTGFERKSVLSDLSDLNFWVNSKAYNVIENTHQIWLLMVCDLIIGKTEYDP